MKLLHLLICIVLFSTLINSYLLDEVQEVEYLPIKFDFKVFLEPFATILSEIHGLRVTD